MKSVLADIRRDQVSKAFKNSIHYASTVNKEKVTENDVSRWNGVISWETLFHNGRSWTRNCLRSYRYIPPNEFRPVGQITMSV
jgi:hypothetical protein